MFRRYYGFVARLFSLATNGVFAAVVVGMAVPGTHRVVWPEAYGLVEIAPRVWTDRPGRADEMLGLVARARSRVSGFFGSAANPTLVLCATTGCARDFGIGGNGLSIADVAVMVAPGGLTTGTLTHEMTHARLHREMGLRNIVRQPYPTWFDEGLATHVANHPRGGGAVTSAARTRVREVERSWQLRAAFSELGVGRTYGAAAAEVASIEAAAGREGLLELIARAEAGERFHRVMAEVLGR